MISDWFGEPKKVGRLFVQEVRRGQQNYVVEASITDHSLSVGVSVTYCTWYNCADATIDGVVLCSQHNYGTTALRHYGMLPLQPRTLLLLEY
jgi:hypothetical protein